MRRIIHSIDYRSIAAAMAGVVIAAGLCAVLLPAILAATAPESASATSLTRSDTPARSDTPDFWAGN